MTSDVPAWSAFDPTAPPALPEPGSSRGRIVALVATDGALQGGWVGVTALQMAASWMASGRRLVLADAGFATPTVHQAAGVADTEGLADLLLWGASVQRVARRSESFGVFVVPAGTALVDGSEAFRKPRWGALCAGFRDAGVTFAVLVPDADPGLDAVLREASEVVVLSAADGDVAAGLDDAMEMVVARVGPPAAGEAPAREEPILDIAELAPDAAGSLEETGAAPPSEDVILDMADLAPDDADVGPQGALEEPGEPGEPGADVMEPAAETLSESPDDVMPAADELAASLDDVASAGDDLAMGLDEAPSAGEELPAVPEDLTPAEEDFVRELEELAPVEGDLLPDLEDVSPSEVEVPPEEEEPLTEEPPAEEPSTEEVPTEETPWEPDGLLAAPDGPAGELAPGDEEPEASVLGELVPEAAADADAAEEPEPEMPEAPAEEAVATRGYPADPPDLAPARGEREAYPDLPGPPAPTFEELVEEAEAVPQRSGGRRTLLLVILLVVVVAVVVAAWLGYVTIPGITPQGGSSPVSSVVDVPTASAAEPAQAAAAEPVRETSPEQGYSVAVASYRDTGPASALVRRLAGGAPGVLFITAPVDVAGTVYHRVLAGPATDSAAADELRLRVGEETGRDPSGWLVRPTPRAFLLSESADRVSAEGRLKLLHGMEIPAYLLAEDYSDGSTRFRVYAGAYVDEAEASVLSGLLEEHGLTATLTRRTGRMP